MKLDPDMHIVMHLVFFGKTGVTGSIHHNLALMLCFFVEIKHATNLRNAIGIMITS
jgi:hypothetical protein